MISPCDAQRFATALNDKLGEQMQNIHLLYEAAPELMDIVGSLDKPVGSQSRQESLPSNELRGRFLLLVQNVFAVLAEIRLLALFLDDIHDAPEAWAFQLALVPSN